MNRRQRAITCAVGIVPVTASNIGLLCCHCGPAWLPWFLELATAAVFYLWIFRARQAWISQNSNQGGL